MKDKLEKMGLAYIWQNQHENNVSTFSMVIKERRQRRRETQFIICDVQNILLDFYK
jgi:hypothetical protein